MAIVFTAPIIPVPVTWNPLDVSGSVTLDQGDTRAFGSSSHEGGRSNFSASSGKWYWEMRIDSMSAESPSGTVGGGIALASADISGIMGVDDFSITFRQNGKPKRNNVQLATLASFTGGAVISHKLDLDAGVYEVSINGNAYTQIDGGTDLSGTWYPSLTVFGITDRVAIVALPGDLTYSIPSGYTLIAI